MSIGKRIKELRNGLGLTQEILARKVGVTKGSIANYENGVSTPKTDVMYKLFSALKCDANYLYQDYLTDFSSISEVNPDMFVLNMYKKLDTEDKAEIRGEMKHMLKSDKYNINTPKTIDIGRTAAHGGESTNLEITEETAKRIRDIRDKLNND